MAMEEVLDHQALDSFMASSGLGSYDCKGLASTNYHTSEAKKINLDSTAISPSNDATELKRKRCDIGEELEGQEKGQKPGDASEEEAARNTVDIAELKRKRGDHGEEKELLKPGDPIEEAARKNVEKSPRISDSPEELIPNEKDGESDETCTPSYHLLPEKEPLKKRLEGIINNQLRSEAPPHESRRRRINEFKQFLYELEDKRYQLDMLHKRFKSAANTAWELLAETYVEEEEEEEPVSAIEEDGEDDDKAKEAARVRERVKSREDRRSQDVKFIELLYGEYGFDVVEAIRKIPRSALPVVITRLVKQLKKSRKFRKDHLKFKDYVLPQNL